ncbi:RNA 2',3'-cyclic phosphodiesterase [Candidatus Bathyarchaeota archaeon A05DMB-2]|jgi:2'-5' RNA ligase|nr:RNA 2',3'-cyclic phosphodiesterase [Candidatus Bathyarchaeota archaeon A05DMB-2]
MSESIRSFIAFDMENDAVLNRISAVQNLLAQTGADLKPVEPRNIHVTIRFLGNITPATAEKIHEEMKKVQFTPFTAKISGIGAFPDVRYPRVVWAGITEGTDQLRSVFSQLEPRLKGLGFTPDPKGFSPHLTIARVRSGRNKQQLADFINKNAKYEFGTINARCLRLKKSVLTSKGPVYSTLKEFCPQP